MNDPNPLRFFSARNVRAALPMANAVDAMKQAFVQLSSGEAEVPLRTHIEAPAHKGNVLVMPCHVATSGRMSVKCVTLFDDNPGRGLPRIQALVVLFDATNGSPLAVMDGASLTALRTGAASGAATDFLARPDAEVVAIFGAGVQGRTQLEAVCAVREIKKARIFDASKDAADAFAEKHSDALGVEIEAAATPSEALAGADIVCTATTAKTPVFADDDIEAGVHINAVGSYQPSVQEIPPETILRARLVVDHRSSALAETGDLIQPLRQGLFGEDHIRAELGEVVSGKKKGRTSHDEITLFKSVGVAVQDLAAAARVLERGERLGLGREVSMHD